MMFTILTYCLLLPTASTALPPGNCARKPQRASVESQKHPLSSVLIQHVSISTANIDKIDNKNKEE